jgi:hypothetical protein
MNPLRARRLRRHAVDFGKALVLLGLVVAVAVTLLASFVGLPPFPR